MCSAEGRFATCRLQNGNVSKTHRVVPAIPCSVCSEALLQAVSVRVCSLGPYLEHLEDVKYLSAVVLLFVALGLRAPEHQ